nr:MAG TPA: hypothetical protein [Caudoviricetes sp.]
MLHSFGYQNLKVLKYFCKNKTSQIYTLVSK